MIPLKPTHQKKERDHSQRKYVYSQVEKKVSLMQVIMETGKKELSSMVLLSMGINSIDTVVLCTVMPIK